MKISEITSCLEKFAPLKYQESYDNAGLIVGNKNTEIEKALICVDVTEKIIDEAIETKSKILVL